MSLEMSGNRAETSETNVSDNSKDDATTNATECINYPYKNGSSSCSGNANVVNTEKIEQNNCDIGAIKQNNGGGSPSDTNKKSKTNNMNCPDIFRAWTYLRDITSWDRLVRLLCHPTDPAMLGFIRFLFGLLMFMDTVFERGMLNAESRWGDPKHCLFPLFEALVPLPLAWMYVIYLLMIVGAMCIMLGLAYRVSCLVYLCCYWYIVLLDKSFWNNHSYLFGLLAFIFTLTDANRYWSIDSLLMPSIKNAHVPLWNYTLFKAQIFLVYTIAGLKKLDPDWVAGYSMEGLSEHWVFNSFRFVLSNEHIDLFVVHFGGLVIDLSAGFLLICRQTRYFALFLTSVFHIMNSRLFPGIGMFPYGMLCIQIIFCEADLPRRLFKRVPPSLRLFTPDSSDTDCVPNIYCVYSKEDVNAKASGESLPSPRLISPTSHNIRHQLVSGFVLAFIACQCFMPFSHGITKGYNGATNGLYGYSWDMMVHAFHFQKIRITYKDRDTNKTGFVDPAFWSGHHLKWADNPDMLKQYTYCIADRLKAYNITNVEIYFDIWYSINGRLEQRAIDPRVDLLRAEWGPFQQTQWFMPLLENLSHWRERREELFSWSTENHSHTILTGIADFPGFSLENYVPSDFSNTNLSVLTGQVIVEQKDPPKNDTLEAGQTIQIPAASYHTVHTISSTPSAYVYASVNMTHCYLLERLEEFTADLTVTQLENETFKNFKDDPYLTMIKEVHRQHKKNEKRQKIPLLQIIFIDYVYPFTRSIKLAVGAVYCLVTNNSFDELLGVTRERDRQLWKEVFGDRDDVVATTAAVVDAAAAAAAAATAATRAASAAAAAATAASTAATAASAASAASAAAIAEAATTLAFNGEL